VHDVLSLVEVNWVPVPVQGPGVATHSSPSILVVHVWQLTSWVVTVVHTPVHTPAEHNSLVQVVVDVHVSSSLHVVAPVVQLATHCVAVPHWPVPLHVWNVVLAVPHWVAPGVQTPEHAPATQA
jgi:hypothetical protein